MYLLVNYGVQIQPNPIICLYYALHSANRYTTSQSNSYLFVLYANYKTCSSGARGLAMTDYMYFECAA